MNILAFDPNRVVSHDFLGVSQYFAIPSKLYKMNEAVVRLAREKGGDRQEKSSIRIRN